MARLGAGADTDSDTSDDTTQDTTETDTSDRYERDDPLSGGTETDSSTPDDTDTSGGSTDTSDRYERDDPLSGGTETDSSTPDSTSGDTSTSDRTSPDDPLSGGTDTDTSTPDSTNTSSPTDTGPTAPTNNTNDSSSPPSPPRPGPNEIEGDLGPDGIEPRDTDFETFDPDEGISGQGIEKFGGGDRPVGRARLDDDLDSSDLDTLRTEGYGALDEDAKQTIQEQIETGADRLDMSPAEFGYAVVGNELLFFQDSADPEDIRTTQAQNIEQQFVQDNPEFDSGDVGVLQTDEGTLQLRFTESGAAKAAAAQAREKYGVDEDIISASGSEVAINVDALDAMTFTSAERRVVSANKATGPTVSQNQSGQPERINPELGAFRAAVSQRGSRVGQSPTRESGIRTFEEFYKDEVAKSASEQTGLNVKSSDVQLDYTDDGIEASIQERERFGDIDWSMGAGGPDDEVEQAVDRAADRVQRAGEGVADYFFADSESAGEEILRAVGRPDLGRAYESSLENIGRGLVGGGTAIVNLPGMAGGVMEGIETGKYFAEETTSGRTGEAISQSTRRGRAIFGQAIENPWMTGGLLVGSLGASSSIMSAAGKVSPRAGLASRALIQPGEEALGYGGYGLTRRVAGYRTAERLFPNQEPLIFSEEAAIRGARAAAGKTKRAAALARSDFEDFVGAERGMARMSGLELDFADTESETGSEFSDEDIVSTDPSPGRLPGNEGAGMDSGEPISGGNPWPDYMLPEGHPLRSDVESGLQTEAERPEATLGESELEREIEDTRVRFETAVGVNQNAQQRAELATRPALELGQRGMVDVRSRADLLSETRSDLELEGELARELALEAEAEAEAEAEVEAELEARQELEIEQEQEFEQEFETEFEPPAEIEAEPDQPWRDESWNLDLDISGSSPGKSTGGRDLGAGYYNEFVTALALGAGPRDAPSRSRLEEFRGAVDLTEQRPTEVMLSGTEEEQEQIEAAEAFLSFGGGEAEDGDWWDML